jgi:hypothetical protein
MRLLRQLTSPDSTPFWLGLLLLSLAVVVLGLGNPYAPSNGDEMVYAHIARETAQTGHWLPLASELIDTRNTKPPILFWQAMVAGQWGEHWTLAALRTPSVIYTLLVAAAVGWSARLLTRQWRPALIAACLYLCFFSTFRYGRVYLTSAPESFWFSLPMFALLWRCLRRDASAQAIGWWQHLFMGLALGIGLAYKSYALIAPAAAAWWLAQVWREPVWQWRTVLSITLRVGCSAVLAVAVFAMWLVLDPDPASVWREFIVGENAGKFSDSRGYWHEALLGGGSSIWSQLLAYAFNAGLLAAVVIGLALTAWQNRSRDGWRVRPAPHVAVLLAWVGVWLMVFTIPSQRSARYVIPAMPAVAILLALYWDKIATRWFLPTLPLAAIALLALARLAWVGHALDITNTLMLSLTMLTTLIGLGLVLLAWRQPDWRRSAAVLLTALVYAALNLTVAPWDGAAGRYPAEATRHLPPQARVAAPNGFNAQFERFQFILPGSFQWMPYDTEARAAARLTPDAAAMPGAAQLSALLREHDAVVWAQSAEEETSPPCLPDCRVQGMRWHLRNRLPPGEVTLSNVWEPQRWLFRREWLLTRATSP